jgi:hypothetical protein
MVCASAQAQEMHCPLLYPQESMVLAGDANGFVAPARLVGGSVYAGELGGIGELQGDRRRVRGGADTRFRFPPNGKRWFVCMYGNGTIGMWTAISPSATSCIIRQRERASAVIDISVKAECK